MPKQTITAVFDTRAHAESAAQSLREIGIPAADVTLSSEDARQEMSDAYGTAGQPRKSGFMASLENLFGGYEDRDTYAEGVRRGGTLLTAHADEAHVDQCASLLEQHGAIDLGEREDAWRSEGWTGRQATGAAGLAGAGALGLAGGGGTFGTATSAEARETTLVPPASTPVMPLGRAAPSKVETTAVEATSAVEARAAAPLVASPVTAGRAAPLAGEDVVQVVEERLDVGKRAVSRGKVRLHSYVVQREVSEEVALHDETVTVDRRAVDRPIATLDADPFRERTIEMEETAEEAVVAKTARVVEEIGIRKDAVDRTETVRDTVRSTKVDIEDGRTGVAAGTRGGMVGGTAGAVGGTMARFAERIRGDMEVVGSDGAHVGMVDRLDGDRLKLKRADAAAGGQHHFLVGDMVESVADKVVLAVTAAEAKARWAAA